MNFLHKLIFFFNEHRRQIFYYLTVGFTTFGIYFGVFSILYERFGLHYKIAVSIAYVLAIGFHFFANRKVTFQAHGHILHVQLVKYFIMIGLNYIITMLVMHVVVNSGLSPYLGMLCSISLTVSLNYLIAKFWVFRLPDLQPSEEI